MTSDFIWDFGKLPFPTHLGKYFIKIGKIRAKIHEIGKIKAIFGLGTTPIYGLKNGQIKSLVDNYILKKNQCIPRPVTIAIVYSLVEHNLIISYCKMLIILLYYTAISKEIILFVNQASLSLSNLSDTHRLKSILRGNINYKAISC